MTSLMDQLVEELTLVNVLIALAVTVVGIPLAVWSYDKYRFRQLPPGPPTRPFIGNKHLIPASRPWLKMAEWSETYGPIYTLWQGRSPTIVISDPAIAQDLMEKRSQIYSSRPRMIVMGEVFTNNRGLLTSPYNEYWRRLRKINHIGLMKSAALSYRPIQENESKRLAMDLVRSPQNFERHLERYAASVVMTVAYGKRVDDMNDPAVQMVLEMMQYMASLNVPGRFLAESFPILAKFPDFMAPWKKEVKANAAYYGKFFFTLGMRAKTRYDNGTLPNCFAKQLWDQREKHQLTDQEVGSLSGGLFGAGSDTSSATMTTFILAMTVFGDKVIPKAHEELDRVVGRKRSPTWTDEENLPYIRAVVKEAFRWRPVAVLGGTPHANTEDDYYNGFFIPKGSTILGNLWAINHNPKYYPDPHTFNPDRYLASDFTYPNQQGYSSFGWGRRVCPGQQVAEQSLFITIARILWGFNIKKAVHADGTPHTYDTYAYTENFNTKPLPFECIIEPRGPEFVKIIEKENAEALDALACYKVDDDGLSEENKKAVEGYRRDLVFETT